MVGRGRGCGRKGGREGVGSWLNGEGEGEGGSGGWREVLRNGKRGAVCVKHKKTLNTCSYKCPTAQPELTVPRIIYSSKTLSIQPDREKVFDRLQTATKPWWTLGKEKFGSQRQTVPETYNFTER